MCVKADRKGKMEKKLWVRVLEGLGEVGFGLS